MQIIQNVVVKQILTENSRKKLIEKYHSQILQLQKECSQLQFELKRLEKSKTFSPTALKKISKRNSNPARKKKNSLSLKSNNYICYH